jgi:hypothetical protein
MNLRHAFGLSLVLFACSGALGCRVNKLPEYQCKLKSARTQVLPAPAGRVQVDSGSSSSSGSGSGSAKPSGVAGLVAGIGKFAAATSAGEKLQHAMPPQTVQGLVGEVVAAEAPNLGLPLVALDKDADTRLEVEVKEFGVFAHGEAEPAKLRFVMYGRLTYLPEGEKIWEYSVIIERNLSDIQIGVGGVGNVTTIAALAGLSEEELGQFFTAATRQATTEFMNKLSTEYRQAKGEGKCKVANVKQLTNG